MGGKKNIKHGGRNTPISGRNGVHIYELCHVIGN